MGFVRNVIVRIGADVKPMQQGLAKAQTSLQGFSAKQKKALYSINNSIKTLMSGVGANSAIMSNAMLSAKAGLTALAVAATVAFGVVAKKALDSAMEVVESESLFEVSLGKMSKAAREWSEELQRTLGLNGYEVRKNVGLFYNMVTAMGLSRDKAYEVSTAMTMLTYDMASFYNLPFEEMFTKVQSGLSGEIEPLRRIGVIVNETVTKQYAYAHGIAEVGKELTEQQKVLARYGIIMEQTVNAQGDLARTIKSPLNQLRIFQNQLTLAKINLGNAFMPIYNIVLPALTDFAKELVRVTETFAQFMKALFGANSVQAQNAQSAADAATAQDKLGDATLQAGKKAKRGLMPFDEINQLQEDLAGNAEAAAEAMSTTPTPAKSEDNGLIPQGMLEAVEKIKTVFQPVMDDLKKSVNDLKTSFKNFWAEVEPELQPIVEWLSTVFVPTFEFCMNYARIQLRMLVGIIDGILLDIQGLLKIWSGILTGDWEKVWEGIGDITEGNKKILGSITQGVMDTVKLGVDTGAKEIEALWKQMGKTMGADTEDAFENVRTTSQKGLGKAWESIKWWRDYITDKMQEKFADMGQKLNEVWAKVRTGAQERLGMAWESIKWWLNFMIKGINTLIKNLNNLVNIKIPDWFKYIPGVPAFLAGKTFKLDLQPITPLARGGIVTSPTLAMIGERGPEAVVPLENTGFVDALASAVGTAVLSAMQMATGQGTKPSKELVLNINGRQFMRAVLDDLDQEITRMGYRSIYQPV